MSYNIENGGLERLHVLSRVCEQHQPDVIALLEATDQQVIDTLAQQGAMHVIYGAANTDAPIAWLSRFPIISSRNHRLAIFSKTLLEIEIMWNNHPLVLFATHLIHGRTKASEGRRIAEVRTLLDVVSKRRMHPHLIVGDFNAIHPRDSLGLPPAGQTKGYFTRKPIRLLLEAGYTDCYRAMHPTLPGYTYPTPQPWMRLDYIFASSMLVPSIMACDCDDRDLAQRASDHLPLWVMVQSSLDSVEEGR